MVALDRAEQCWHVKVKWHIQVAAFLSFEFTRMTHEVCIDNLIGQPNYMAAKLCVLDGQMLGSSTFYYSVLQPSTYNHTITMFYYYSVKKPTTTYYVLQPHYSMLQPYYNHILLHTATVLLHTATVLLRTTPCYSVQPSATTYYSTITDQLSLK